MHKSNSGSCFINVETAHLANLCKRLNELPRLNSSLGKGLLATIVLKTDGATHSYTTNTENEKTPARSKASECEIYRKLNKFGQYVNAV